MIIEHNVQYLFLAVPQELNPSPRTISWDEELTLVLRVDSHDITNFRSTSHLPNSPMRASCGDGRTREKPFCVSVGSIENFRGYGDFIQDDLSSDRGASQAGYARRMCI
jgi:hypothetical protein